jgi:hypothetical protein
MGTVSGPGKVIRFPAAPVKVRDDRGLVEVHRCPQAEALVVKSLFESEGIPTLFRSRLAQSVHPFTVGDQGQVAILVPEGDVQRGRILLTRTWRGPSSP